MSTFAEPLGEIKKPWQWIVIGVGILLIWSAVALPNLMRSKGAGSAEHTEPAARFYEATPPKAKPVAAALDQDTMKVRTSAAPVAPDIAAGRKIIRTSSMEMVVQHPAEVADKITALAEGLGGYLVSADDGGHNASAGVLTIRVAAARFEEARAEIRKLGLRVESEKVDAQDVSRQYIDQDANIRNLRAEEAGYLAILKQAHTVKDMLAVTEPLSEVRGQIEQQQAEFNALSRQIETVALTISLRTEAEAQVMGLNWRPGYQLKLAFRDGLDSLATYATTMTTILFYFPALLLWVGTIGIGTAIGWKTVLWVGRRWFGWSANSAAVQV
jgi:Sec-independent protein translocase protein TatA